MSMMKILAELFELKIPNPVVSFWFCSKKNFENGDVNLPEDFEKYSRFGEKELDGITWLCFGKKEVPGCFSKDYWHK